MQISESEIRKFVLHFLNESNLERVNELAAQADLLGYALVHVGLRSSYEHGAILYDPKIVEKIKDLKNFSNLSINPVIAFVFWSNDPEENNCEDSGVITYSASKEGSKMGPIPYEYSLWASKKGITPDRRAVTKYARSVWKKYAERPDVEKRNFSKDAGCVIHNDELLDKVYSIKSLGAPFRNLTNRHSSFISKMWNTAFGFDLTKFLIGCAMSLFSERYTRDDI